LFIKTLVGRNFFCNSLGRVEIISLFSVPKLRP
jgi:hypothetical protein